MLRTLWASVEVSPRTLQRINGWLTILWLLVLPAALVSGWIYSVAFVSAISIYANVAGHASAWQAARVETKQEQDDGPRVIR